ncbi:MAG: hypothetical protein HDR49_00210 [Bacteroides sp.]|nr:hypothetical protein [Bacteroides sp.]
MTHICNTFSDYATKIEKAYTIEVVDYDGIATIVDVYAYNAEEAQQQAADSVENADFTTILFATIL